MTPGPFPDFWVGPGDEAISTPFQGSKVKLQQRVPDPLLKVTLSLIDESSRLFMIASQKHEKELWSLDSILIPASVRDTVVTT